jgi:putative tryptophan/tyrosine transport system substrate-binding protein
LKFDALVGDRQVIANESFGVSRFILKGRVRRLPLRHRSSEQSLLRIVRSLHGNYAIPFVCLWHKADIGGRFCCAAQRKLPVIVSFLDGVGRGHTMRRREFIALFGSVAAAWPLVARAQQFEHMRRIGVLMSGGSETDQQASLAVFKEILHQLGLIDGRNVRVEVRWTGGDPVKARKDAEELVALPTDVILATGQLPLQTLLQVTRSVPIVFIGTVDPVGSGFIDSLAGKWVELLKQITPTVTRVAVLRDAALPAGIGQFAVIQSVAPSIGVDVSLINMRDAGQIEQDITRFASSPNGGLILTPSALAVVHQNLVVALAAQHKLPAVYHRRYFVTSGGLISYGPDIDEQYRGAAGYVNRILKGEKPADLPVQAPTKYELVVNLKTQGARPFSATIIVVSRR